MFFTKHDQKQIEEVLADHRDSIIGLRDSLNTVAERSDEARTKIVGQINDLIKAHNELRQDFQNLLLVLNAKIVAYPAQPATEERREIVISKPPTSFPE